MIRIGLGVKQKEKLVNEYLKNNSSIKQIFVLYCEKTKQKLKFNLPHEEVEYDEWEMYRTFYPMIEKVDTNTLIIVNESLRSGNMSDLKTNCATVWLNQTTHRIIFNLLPFIENKDDFRVLQKFEKAKKSVDDFDYIHLQTQDILVKPNKIKINIINVQTTEKEKEKYNNKKEKTAEMLENDCRKDPDILLRELQLLAGDFKKKFLEEDKNYIARNKRLKLNNIHTLKDYDKSKEYIFIDLPINKRDLIDYILNTKNYTINYICTDLSVDNLLLTELTKWKARLDSFYAKANIYK